jgi:hypothetical protein
VSKRQIPAKQVVADIKGGMSDAILRERYRLSPRGLESLFKKLLALNLITQAELDERCAGKETVTSVDSLELDQRGVGPSENISSDDNEVRADAQSALQDGISDAQDSLADSALVAFEEGEESERERKWHEHWLAVFLFLILLPPVGLYLLWKSPRLKIGTKAVLTCVVPTLIAAAVLYSRDNINFSLWYRLTKQTSGWAQVSHEAVPLANQQGTEALGNDKGLSDCEEKEPLFPVRPVRDNGSAKEVLTTILRLQVFMRHAGARAYYRSLRSLTKSEPPEPKMLFRDFFDQEYGCRMDPDDMEMMRHLVNDLVEDKITKAFASSVGTQPKASAGTDATDKEMEEEFDRKMRWLQGEAFLARLKLVKKDTPSCNRALKETIAFVGGTVDKAVHDCREYEKTLAERETRIRQCRQRINPARTGGAKDSGVSAKR